MSLYSSHTRPNTENFWVCLSTNVQKSLVGGLWRDPVQVKTELENVCVHKPYGRLTHLISTSQQKKGEGPVKLNGWLSWPGAAPGRQTEMSCGKATALQLWLNIHQADKLNSSPRVTQIPGNKIKKAFLSVEGDGPRMGFWGTPRVAIS